MSKLNQIVKQMLEQHEGGEEFFNHLDRALQNKIIIFELYKLIDQYYPKPMFSIVSGNFGKFYLNSSRTFDQIFYVNGGLRKGVPIDDLSYLNNVLKNKKIIFIDDSFYSGKTRDVVKKEIERLGGEIVQTFVIYDGSKEKDNTVKSLYRYYDNH